MYVPISGCMNFVYTNNLNVKGKLKNLEENIKYSIMAFRQEKIS